MLECYRDKDCMERFCKNLKEHETKIISYERKKMMPLTDKKLSPMKSKKFVIYAKKNLVLMMIEYQKVRDNCHCTGKYRGAAHDICNLRYEIPKEIPVVFHNGSTYDYHFIIKELAKDFEGKFECYGENAEKYITFSVPIEKELDKCKAISCKLKFIDSFRLMSTSLSKLIENNRNLQQRV